MIQYQIWVKVETNIMNTVMKFFMASNNKMLRVMLIGMYA